MDLILSFRIYFPIGNFRDPFIMLASCHDAIEEGKGSDFKNASLNSQGKMREREKS